MWGEDDFADNSNQIKVVLRDKARELISDPDPEPEGKAERFDG